MKPQNYRNTSHRERPAFGNADEKQPIVDSFLRNNGFSSDWITTGADENMITFAEKAGSFMAKEKLSSSQIRNVYGEIKRIQMKGYAAEKTSFLLLKPKMAYAVGRQQKGKDGYWGVLLFKKIFDECYQYVKDETTFENLCKFMEAILAYHRAIKGKE